MATRQKMAEYLVVQACRQKAGSAASHSQDIGQNVLNKYQSKKCQPPSIGQQATWVCLNEGKVSGQKSPRNERVASIHGYAETVVHPIIRIYSIGFALRRKDTCLNKLGTGGGDRNSPTLS